MSLSSRPGRHRQRIAHHVQGVPKYVPPSKTTKNRSNFHTAFILGILLMMLLAIFLKYVL